MKMPVKILLLERKWIPHNTNVVVKILGRTVVMIGTILYYMQRDAVIMLDVI